MPTPNSPSAPPVPSSAADLRLGQRWTRWQAWKNNGLYWLARLALGLVGRLPASALLAACHGLAWLTWLLWPGGRRRTTAQLSAAGFASDAPSSRQVFRGLADVLWAQLLAWRQGPHNSPVALSPEGAQTLSRCLEAGGVVFLTLHLGPWEAMAQVLCQADFPIHTFARRSYDPRLDGLVYGPLRQARGVGVLYRGERGNVKRCLRLLKQGAVVGFPIDLPGRGVHAQRHALAGSFTAPLALQGLEIAARAGASVVVGAPVRVSQRKWSVEIFEIKNVDQEPLERVLASVVKLVTENPTDWIWPHDFSR